MKYKVGGKINPKGDTLEYLQGVDYVLSDLEKKRNINIKFGLDVNDQKKAEELLEAFDEKSKNGMNDYYTFRSVALERLTDDYEKLKSAKQDAEFNKTDNNPEFQKMIEKRSNAIVRQANAYIALGGQVTNATQEIFDFAKAQEKVLMDKSGGGYQYTVDNFKELFDIMAQLMPLLEKSEGLSKNFARFSIKPENLSGIAEKAKQAEEYLEHIYEEYGTGELRQGTRNEVIKSMGIVKEYYDIMARLKRTAPQYPEAYRNAAQLDIPVGFSQEESYSAGVSTVKREYDKIISQLREEALQRAEKTQKEYVEGYKELIDQGNEAIDLVTKQFDATKKQIDYLKLEQEKKLATEWGSLEGARPKFSETGDIAGAYTTNESFTAASELYDSLFDQIKEGALSADEAIELMAKDLFAAVSKGEATPFVSEDILQLQAEIDSLRAKVEELRQALRDAKDDAESWGNAAARNLEDKWGLEDQIEQLRNKLEDKEREIDALMEENDRLREHQGDGYGYGYGDGDGIGSFTDAYVQELKDTISDLTARMEALEQVLEGKGVPPLIEGGYSPDYVGVAIAELTWMREAISDLNLDDFSEVPSFVEGIKNKLDVVSQSVDSIKDALLSGKGTIQNITNLGIGNEDDPAMRKKYDELMEAFNSVFALATSTRRYVDEEGNVTGRTKARIAKVGEQSAITFDEIASAIVQQIPEVASKYRNSVSAFEEVYSVEKIQAQPIADRIKRLQELLGWIRQLSKAELGDDVKKVIKSASKKFPDLTKEETTENKLGFSDSLNQILDTLREIARRVSEISNSLTTGAVNDIPDLRSDFLTDRGQILKDLFGKIETTKNGTFKTKASNLENVKEFLRQFNEYGDGEWNLDEFARINDVSKKNLGILKQCNEELFGQKEVVTDIADKQEELANETAQSSVAQSVNTKVVANLEGEVSDITEAVKEKNSVFEEEKTIVDTVVDAEKEKLKELQLAIDDVIEALKEKNEVLGEAKPVDTTNKSLEKEKELLEDIAEKQEEIKKPSGELPYMTDEHGKEIKWYRGTRGSSDVGAFESNRFGGATFWTTNPMTAATYGDKKFPQRIYESLQASLKPFIVNAKGRNWNNLPFFGVDDKAESLVDDYFHGVELLKRTGDSDNFEAHLKQLSKEWTNIREALLHKAFGDIDSVKDELLTEKNIFSDQYDWLDSLRFSPDEISELGRLFKRGLSEALQNRAFGIKNTKEIVDYVQNSGKYDSVLFKDIIDIGGGGSVRARDYADREKFKSDIIVQFDPTHIKNLGNGPSQKYLDETWAKSIIEEFLYSYGRHVSPSWVVNKADGSFGTKDMSENIQDFRTYVSREAFLQEDSIVQYFASLPDEIGQKILDALHSNSIDTEKYGNEIEDFITDYLLGILEHGGGIEEAYNKLIELDPDLDTNSFNGNLSDFGSIDAYRRVVKSSLNRASSLLSDEDLKSLARDELKNAARQISPAVTSMQQLLALGDANDIRQALSDDGTLKTNLLSGIKKILIQEISGLWLDYLKGNPTAIMSDVPISDDSELTLETHQETLNNLKEEKELREEVNDLVEEKNALEKGSAVEEENAALEEEKGDLKEVNDLLEEKNNLKKESATLSDENIMAEEQSSIDETIDKKDKAFQEEQEVVTNVIDAEKEKLKELEKSVKDVTDAVKKKTKAFEDEGKKVTDTVEEEKAALMSLPSVVENPTGAGMRTGPGGVPLLTQNDATTNNPEENTAVDLEEATLKYIKAVSALDNLLEKVPDKMMDFELHFSDVLGQSYYKTIQDAVNDLTSRTSAINEMPNDALKLDEMQKITPIISKYSSVIQEFLKSHDLLADSLSMKKVKNNIGKYIADNTALTDEQRTRLIKLREAIEAAFDPNGNNVSMTKEELKQIVSEFEESQAEARQFGNEGQSALYKVSQQVAHLNEKWVGQLLSFHDIIRYIRTMYTEIKNIDSALIELKKVTDGLTMERLNISLENSLETARELGSEVTEVINTTADWARLGYGIEDAEELARVTTLFKNVGDNLTTDTASEYLISTLKGFEMKSDEALTIVDKFNEVANNFAIDTSGIGQALERSSASFNAANTSLSESIALVTTANAVVQNPESVGTTFKTLSARIRGATTELEELGEEEDDFTKSTSKLRGLVKGLTGFDIMADEDTFKSIYEILIGIGHEWDKLTDVERASLGEALAGKRNSNVLFAIMNNIEELEKAYATAEQAAGSATREQENYQRSIQYSVDVLKAEVSELYTKVLDSKQVKGFVDVLAQGLKYVVQIADKLPAIAVIGSMFGASAVLGNTRRMGQLSMFLDGLITATNALVNKKPQTAWNDLMNTVIAVQKSTNGGKDTALTSMATSLKNPATLAAIAKWTLGLTAIVGVAYGVSRAIDSMVDSVEEIEKRMEESSEKISEYDAKLTELRDRLDEISSMDMTAYSQTQQQNLKDEAKYVGELIEQYEKLKIAYEESYAKDRADLWFGEQKYNPFSKTVEKFFSGQWFGDNGAFDTYYSAGAYRGDNAFLKFLVGGLLGTSAIGQFFNQSEGNKSEDLDEAMEQYEKLAQKIQKARETQKHYLELSNQELAEGGFGSEWGSQQYEKEADKYQAKVRKYEAEQAKLYEEVLKNQAELLEMRERLQSKDSDLFTAQDAEDLKDINEQLAIIDAFLKTYSEVPDNQKRLANHIVGEEVMRANMQGQTREDLAGDWITQLTADELKKLGEIDLSGATFESLEQLKDYLKDVNEEATETVHTFKDVGALLSSDIALDPDFPEVTWGDVKDDLVGLAQAGKLDDKTLKQYKYYDDILDALGISASDAEDHISEMIDAINRMAEQNAVDILSDYRTEVDKLDDAYQKFKGNEFIDANTLSALQDAFGDMDSFQAFQQAVMEGDKDLQHYFDDMVTEYAIAHSALSEVTEDTKKWTKQQLVASGITEKSAEDSINAVLANKEATEQNIRTQIEEYNTQVALDESTKDLAISTDNLNDLTAEEVVDLLQAADASGKAAEQIAIFTLKKELANGKSLRNADDLEYLKELIIEAGVGIELINRLQALKKTADIQQGNQKELEKFWQAHPDENRWTPGDRAQYNALSGGTWAIRDFEDVYNEVWHQVEKKTEEHLDYTSGVALSYGGAMKDAAKSASDAAAEFKDALDKILAMYDAELDAGVISFQTYVDKSRAIIEQYYRDGKIKAQDYYDELASLYEKQVQQYDKVISAVQKRLQDETDALEKQKETIENSYNEQIEIIQKKIDALQDENDEIDRNLELSKAQYELARAQNQRTKLMYSESRGFYYAADLQGISDAEDNLRKARTNKQVAEYEKQIKSLQDAMESETKSIDDQIKKLNEYSEAWGKVSSKLEEAQNNLRATEILGPDWEANILSGLSLLEDFTNQYVLAQQKQKQAYLDARTAEANNPVNAEGGGTVNSGGTGSSGGGGGNGGNGGSGGGNTPTGHSQGNANNGNIPLGTLAEKRQEQQQDEDKYEFNGVKYKTKSSADQARMDYIDSAGAAAYNQAMSYSIPDQNTKVRNAEKARKEAEAEARKKQVKALFSGTDSAKPGKTLVGEIAPEIVVHNNGTASIVDSPTLMDMKGGEKVFNGDETEKILKSKYVPMKQYNPKKFAMLHAFAGGTSSPLQNAIAAQAVGIASGIKSGLIATTPVGGQTINQTFNITMPNITDASKANELFREFEQLSRRATQYYN